MSKAYGVIAGHGKYKGKYDPGAVSKYGKEAEETQKLADKVIYYIQKTGNKVKDYIAENMYQKLQHENVSFKGLAGVLEIHFNASVSGSAKGTEIFAPVGDKVLSQEKRIASFMGKYFTKRGDAGLKHTDFYVIKKIDKQGIEAMLLEVCFITNKSDMEIYRKNFDAIAKGIAEALTGNKVKSDVKPKPKTTPIKDKSTNNVVSRTPLKVNKVVKLNKNAKLWDFNFSNWNSAKAIKSYKKGETINVYAIGKNKLGGEYYMTEYSYKGGKTTGFNIKDCEEIKSPKKTDNPINKEKEKEMAEIDNLKKQVAEISKRLDNELIKNKQLNKELKENKETNSKLANDFGETFAKLNSANKTIFDLEAARSVLKADNKSLEKEIKALEIKINESPKTKLQSYISAGKFIARIGTEVASAHGIVWGLETIAANEIPGFALDDTIKGIITLVLAGLIIGYFQIGHYIAKHDIKGSKFFKKWIF